MLGKVVLTLLVMAIAIVVIRQRSLAESGNSSTAGQGTGGSKAGQSAGDSTGGMASDMRFAAYLFLILMFGAAAVIYYQRWQEDHTVLTVNLFRDGQSEPVSYEVYQFQLQSRSFTTTDGIQITVANNERMEVSERAQP